MLIKKRRYTFEFLFVICLVAKLPEVSSQQGSGYAIPVSFIHVSPREGGASARLSAWQPQPDGINSTRKEPQQPCPRSRGKDELVVLQGLLVCLRAKRGRVLLLSGLGWFFFFFGNAYSFGESLVLNQLSGAAQV